jgi:NTE family protein
MAKKTVSLALQGGGTHLAFSWGVIDYLLEDGRFEIEGGSGTSAGGLTCAALAQGLMKNGNQGGRDELAAFWKMVSEQGTRIGLIPSVIDKMLSSHGMEYSPALSILSGLMAAHLSPYQWNPNGENLFRTLLTDFFDFDKLSEMDSFKLFLTATNVRNSKLKIFTGHGITPEAVMASSCLPLMSQAVEIDGESYWDGGYIGNPSLFPLIYNCESADIIVILVIPHEISNTPTTYKEIKWRMEELFHTSTLIREMRAIEFVTSLIDQGIADTAKLKKVNVHVIEDSKFMSSLGPASMLNTEWDFLQMLYKRGRSVAAEWLENHYEDIGKRSSTNVKDTFV